MGTWLAILNRSCHIVTHKVQSVDGIVVKRPFLKAQLHSHRFEH